MDKKRHSTKKLTQEQFVEKARLVHGNKYNYSKVNYINNRTKICIICPKHGEFWQRPGDHLNGCGCVECFNDDKRGKSSQLNTISFIEKARKIHSDKYDYSKVEYVNNHTKVCIICPRHGEFWQTPNDHLDGCGCPMCGRIIANRKTSSNKEHFIEKARKIHSDKYDYSKVEYVNNHTKVCIICPRHGEFWQTPHSHLCGRECPYCKTSKMEKEISMLLKENNIKYSLHERKLFKTNVELDFYLPDYNIAIECQGEQHFKPIKHFGGNEKYRRRIKNDELKRYLCEKNNIKLFYYSNIKNFNFPYTVFSNKEELLKEIKNGQNI